MTPEMATMRRSRFFSKATDEALADRQRVRAEIITHASVRTVRQLEARIESLERRMVSLEGRVRKTERQKLER